LTHPRGHFSGHNISALRGCCALKFLHALETDQALIAHSTLGTGVPKNCNRENLKFGLKFSVRTPITSGLVWEYPDETFPGDVAQGRGDNVRTTFGRPAP